MSEIASWLVGQPLDAVERELIRHTLESCGGNRVLAAGILGISLPALRKKLTAYAVRGQAIPVSDAPARRRRAAAPVEEKQPSPREPAAAANENSAERQPAEESRAPTQAPQAPQAVQALQAVHVPPVVEVPLPANDRAPVAIPAAPPPAPAAAKPEKPKMMRFRFLLGAVVVAAAVALLALRLFGAGEARTELGARESPRLQLSVMEDRQPFERRIPVPAWIAPPQAQAAAMPPAPPAPSTPPVMRDIAADRRPAPAAAAVAPAPKAIAVTAFDADTRMDLGPVDIAQDTRMEPGPIDVTRDTRMEIAIDAAQDLRMELAVAAEDTPETTGSIGAATTFVAPENVPVPPARAEAAVQAEPVQPARTTRPRAARPAPARAETPQQAFPLLFPFNIFAKGAQQPAAPGLEPVDCCIRN